MFIALRLCQGFVINHVFLNRVGVMKGERYYKIKSGSMGPGDVVFFEDFKENSKVGGCYHVAICCEITEEGIPRLAHAATSDKVKQVIVNRMKVRKDEAYSVYRFGDDKLRSFAAEIAREWSEQMLPYDESRYKKFKKSSEADEKKDLGGALENSKRDFLNDGYLIPIKFALRYLFCNKKAIWPGGKSFICHHFVISVLDTARILISYQYLFKQRKKIKENYRGTWPSIKHYSEELEDYAISCIDEETDYNKLVGEFVKGPSSGKPALPLVFFFESCLVCDGGLVKRMCATMLGLHAKNVSPKMFQEHLDSLCKKNVGRCEKMPSIFPVKNKGTEYEMVSLSSSR